MNRALLWGSLAATLAVTAWGLADDARQAGETVALVRDGIVPRAGHREAGVSDTDSRAPLAPVRSEPLHAVRSGSLPTAPRADGLPERTAAYATRRDPFAGALFDVPPPAPPPPPAAAPVEAPPPPPPPPQLPFTFGGRLTTAAGTSALLHDGPRTLVVAPGETVQGFRFDADGPGQLEFTHVDSGTHLSLPTRP